MSIATRTGDDGWTGLFGAGRVRKDHLRVDAYGDVDELNAFLGLLRAEGLDSGIDTLLNTIQSTLFDLGAELATPRDGNPMAKHVAPFEHAMVASLDAALELHEATLPAMTHFILPGGSRAASLFHVARTIARRAERRVVTLSHHEPVPESCVKYLNRLSDLLFILARRENQMRGIQDSRWVATPPPKA